MWAVSCYYPVSRLPYLLLHLQFYRLKIWPIRDACSTHNPHWIKNKWEIRKCRKQDCVPGSVDSPSATGEDNNNITKLCTLKSFYITFAKRYRIVIGVGADWKKMKWSITYVGMRQGILNSYQEHVFFTTYFDNCLIICISICAPYPSLYDKEM